jgi:signal peptidase II
MRSSLAFTRLLSWLIASEIILLDQWSKTYVLSLDQQSELPIEITSFFNIVLTWNKGVSFGMLHDMQAWMPLALIAATSCIALFMAVWLHRATEKHTILALGCVIGGAIGNIIDRMRFGAVVDFLDAHINGYHWPAFNLADSTIFVGVVILIFGSIVCRPSQTEEVKPLENQDHVSP